jgi:hypothetical protein
VTRYFPAQFPRVPDPWLHLKLLSQLCCVYTRVVDFEIFHTIKSDSDRFLGFLTGNAVDQLDDYISNHGVLFLCSFSLRRPIRPNLLDSVPIDPRTPR